VDKSRSKNASWKARVSETKKSFEEEMSGSVKCLTDKFFTDSANCVKNAKCGTLQDYLEKCMKDKLD
jgi:hypothetical protein